MSDLFDIAKFNVISDEENYYFFRSLEPGDREDLENGIITSENGNYLRLRTDRERWEENHPEEKPRWNKDSEISLEEMYTHIKMHYSLQTNCNSLSSNANVVRMYGYMYNPHYFMITVPKKEMGERVFHAGEYMLDEIQKRIDEYLVNNEVDSGVLEDLEKVEHATDSSQIKKLIETRYKSEQPIDTRKSSMRKDVAYSSPHSRISRYQALDEEQNLAKNKIVAKLTILERKGKMPKLMKRTRDNESLISTVGGAFSSLEQIYYGDIEGEKLQTISKEMLDMFGLLQQIKGQDEILVKELKLELIKAVKEGKQIEIPTESQLSKEYKVKDNISIEEMYKLTRGRVEYTKANNVVQKMFYLSRSRLYAQEMIGLLNKLTDNNPKYKDILDYIEKNGFEIEPEIFTRVSNKGVNVSESVSINLRSEEKELAEEIKGLSQEEYIGILENGGLLDVQGLITSTFSKLQSNEEITKERYYAEAIIDSYNWEEICKNGLNDDARKELIEKLQNFDIVEIYNNMKSAGVSEKDISKYVLNFVTRNSLVEETDFSKMFQENEELLKHKLSVEQIDRFLGYYDVKDADFELRNYQQDAFDNSKELLSKRRFASVVMPTGGGKSFVSIAHILEHKDEKMLYLAPDDEILNQMMDYIIENVEGLSKTSEKKSKREIIKEKLNIEFETYPGLMAKRNKDLLKEQFDFIVLDELHRTGADKWEKKLDKLLKAQKEETKVLGITATPTRDVDGRDMSAETAVKLGYTKEETENGEHNAYYLDLVEAIQLGLVVNPKIVSCEYTLTQDGSLERLKEAIEAIEDEQVKAEKMKKFNELSKRLENAEGIADILKDHIKKGQRIIAFLPASAIIADGDKKIGEEKIKEYQKKLEEYFKDSEITPEFYSMLGAYGADKNEAQLKGFETNDSDDTKFMLVIDKAREGLHIAGLNGMIWFRALDENSYILYHQQLGRVIYSVDPLNPPKDKDRPIVIDLANNTFRVNMNKKVNTYTSRSDLDLLCSIVDWVEKHNSGILPNVESFSKQEKRFSATLYRLQNKYIKYFDDEILQGVDKEKQNEIKAILEKGFEIDLWDTELFPPIPEEKIDEILKVDAFEVSGVLKDFVELEEEIESYNSVKNVLRIESWCKEKFKDKEIWERRLPSSMAEDEEEKRLGQALGNLRRNLKQYNGKNFEEIEDDEDRKIIEILIYLEDEYAFGYKQKHYKLGQVLEIENWCKTKFENKEKWERRLPILGRSSDDEEKRLGGTLITLRKELKQYKGKKLEEIEDEEDRRVVEILRYLEDEYAFGYQQKYQSLGQLLEIENWCKTKFENKEKWERKLPILGRSSDDEEKRLSIALMKIKAQMKSYNLKEIEDIENEEDRKIAEILTSLEDEYAFGIGQNHYNLGTILEIENWCKTKFENKEKWERRLPNRNSENKQEKRLGVGLWNLRHRLKQYEGKRLEEIEDEEYRKIAEILTNLEDGYAFGYQQKYQSLGQLLEIENWCKTKFENKEKWERRLPTIGKEAEDEEKRIGYTLFALKEKLKPYEGKKLEEIEDEEDRQVVEMLINLDDEYAFGRGQKHYKLGQVLEIENWCKIKFKEKEKWERRLPNRKAKNMEEKRLGQALGNLRQKLKPYEGKKIEEIENEDDRKITEIIRRLDEEYNPKKVTCQSLGQAGFGSSVEECDKAQADLNRRVEELESAKGVTQDEN